MPRHYNLGVHSHWLFYTNVHTAKDDYYYVTYPHVCLISQDAKIAVFQCQWCQTIYFSHYACQNLPSPHDFPASGTRDVPITRTLVINPVVGFQMLLSTRRADTFPAARHCCSLASIKLYCWMTEAYRCEWLFYRRTNMVKSINIHSASTIQYNSHLVYTNIQDKIVQQSQ